VETPFGEYTGKDILRAVIGAVEEHEYIEGWTENQRERGWHVPSGDLVHLRLKRLSKADVVRAFEALNGELISILGGIEPRRKPVHLAIDPHGMPFYGEYDGPEICGAKHERGTSWTYKFAGISVVNGRRIMLQAIPMNQFTDKAQLIRELLRTARRFVKILAVYLDKEFYAVPYLKELEASGERYIVPVRSDKKLNEEKRRYKPLSRVVGTRGCSYYKTVRTVVSGKESVDVQTVFLYRPEGEGDFVFVTNQEVTDENVELLAEDYSRRWGIETSFRMTETARGRTCSQDHAVRWLLHLLSVLLYNLWQLVDAMLIHICGVEKKQYGYAIKMKGVMRWLRELVEADIVGAIG
jgi:putative transposase